MRILYVVIAAKDVPLAIQNSNEVAHVCPRQLKEGVEQLGYEADFFPIAGTVSKWNYLKGAVKFFWMSLRGDLDKYDIIHAHYGFHGVVARCQFRKPLVLTLMGSDVYRRWERLIARVLVKLVDAVIVPGGQMRALIDNYPAEVVPYGTDLDVFVPMDKDAMRQKLGLPKDKKLVLFPYNPTRVYHKRPDIIEAAVKQIEGAEMAVVYGKSSPQVAEYMNACDVLAMASSYEGSPGTIREALACNMPIVSVDVADVKDHITEVKGCYLCERDPNDMAAKLRLAFADNQRLADGRQHVLHLGLKECAARTIEIYKRVLQKRGKA
jgi:glycosyltransferase involved in cell wall biosynthesis